MQTVLMSVMVDDQQKALAFYTEKLGFLPKQNIPMGDHSWLTVASADGPAGVEVALEPVGAVPEARAYQQALYNGSIPLTAFGSADLDREYERLHALGVAFRSPPTDVNGLKSALFEDTCGNLIMLFQM